MCKIQSIRPKLEGAAATQPEKTESTGTNCDAFDGGAEKKLE
jgi:hypothetical protein